MVVGTDKLTFAFGFLTKAGSMDAVEIVIQAVRTPLRMVQKLVGDRHELKNLVIFKRITNKFT
jgi:hypothetical protein